MEKVLTEDLTPDEIARIKVAIDECFAEIRRIRAGMRRADEQMAKDQEEKESLYESISLLSEEEARDLLVIFREFQQQRGISLTLRKLANDPIFKVPQGKIEFRDVEPIRSDGRPAAEMLSEDRG